MTIKAIRESKNKDRLVMLTAYDAITATMAAAGGVDIILAGDSLANTALGMADTLSVSFQTMIEHARAVVRAAGDIPVVFDMPFLSYGISEEETIRRCGEALQQTGCQAVKMEGGRWLAPAIIKLARIGVPVMGHLGLQPQHVHQYGGMFVQGREAPDAADILKDAHALQEAGAFAIVAECIPESLGAALRDALSIPVIGIGAGAALDGQVLVISDLLGLSPAKTPKHAKQFVNLFSMAEEAIKKYSTAVRDGSFPVADNCFR